MMWIERLRLPLVIAWGVIIVDQMTKWLILLRWPQPYTGEIDIIPWWLSLTYIRNEGVAFGLFQGVPQLFTVTSILITAGLIYTYLRHLPNQKLPVSILTGLIIGGAIGNVIDRLRWGYVVDFIKTLDGRFPIFNVADMCVSMGVISLSVYLYWLERRELRTAQTESA